MTDDPIDPAVFANLVEMTGGEMDFVDELVDTYLEDGERQIAAMREAAAGGDTERLGRAAHSLKSGSLNVGAMDFGAVCRSLEEAARAGAVSDAAEHIDAIAIGFENVRGALLDERARRARAEPAEPSAVRSRRHPPPIGQAVQRPLHRRGDPRRGID